MKKIIFPLFVSLFSLNAIATQNSLDQAKVNTVIDLYQNKSLEEDLFTKEFYNLWYVAQDIYNQIVSDNAEDTVDEYCEGAFDYVVFNAGKPIFKIVNGDVNAVFKKNRKKDLVYKLECKNGKCLISDVITQDLGSHKQYMKTCIKNYKPPF